MDLTARIRLEDSTYWADVPELPGVFATGDTLDELFESLREGVELYLERGDGSQGPHGFEPGRPLSVATAVLTDRPLEFA